MTSITIGDDFTVQNVARVAEATSNWVIKNFETLAILYVCGRVLKDLVNEVQ